MDDDLALALQLADLADAITLARYRAEDLVVETKPDLTPVGEADKEVEQTLRARLAEVRPGDEIVGEEFGDSQQLTCGRRWILDPIDGTKSYVRGMPTWSTLIALAEERVVSAGVVSSPALPPRWCAARGQGAHADGRPIRRISRLDAGRCTADLELDRGLGRGRAARGDSRAGANLLAQPRDRRRVAAHRPRRRAAGRRWQRLGD